MSINKVILVGNVGKDPEIRHLDNNVAVANFPLATSETYTNKNGERITNTEWHNVVAWRGLAEVCEKYVQKGKQLYIEGKIRTRSYEQDGTKKYMTEIYADTLQMLGRKDDFQNDSAPDRSSATVSEPNGNNGSFDNSPGETEEDDLPF
ncbi:single-stranded DNA-binding protein [Prolixibacter denitrificans]|uniref:Single-stranded DNA-binding protein n=1 Tax=Prolixibacter denitrificans TaxID=1541063 RepID=A0A2P8CCW5_9BACT|nr:single-stranded DNA-binding protein [Prolixibacter denitrificans]PSK82818.1 single-strand DNA-binding protein [Prolixibacter denitrificans]GET21367.1 single-stranded DNA-binding protein [Prolixibacter denitrificans]